MPRRTSERFLLTARRAEIRSLEQMCRSCEVVRAVSELVHQLQKERGLSNIYLESNGSLMKGEREAQILLCRHEQDRLLAILERNYLAPPESGGSVRFYSHTALALNQLENLDSLRQRVTSCKLSAEAATEAYSELMEALLGIVFEAADIASDPGTTRFLVALFNLMQGKEYAGQERAWVAKGFTAGSFSDTLNQQIRHLQEAQQQALQVFQQFADNELLAQYQALSSQDRLLQFERMRKLVQDLPTGQTVTPDLAAIWYDLATFRIDHFRDLEKALTSRLQEISEESLARVRAGAAIRGPASPAVAASSAGRSSSPLVTAYQTPGDGSPAELSRTLTDMIQQQKAHIEAISLALDEARDALQERKLLDRAKGLLMDSMGLTEEQAYRTLQKRAMEKNLRLTEVASGLIEAARAARSRAE